MKKQIQRSFLFGLMFITALFPFALTPVAHAAGETAKITPATGALQTGNSFIVSVDGYVGSVFLGNKNVTGSINFPANLLSVSSISMNGASFPIGTPTYNNSTGVINFNLKYDCGTFCGRNNQAVHLFNVMFTSKNSGTANVTFGTVKYNSGTAATTGGTYTILPLPSSSPSPSPSPSPTPKPSKSPKPTSKPKPNPSSTPKPSKTPEPKNNDTDDEDDFIEEEIEPVQESDGGVEIQNVVVNATRDTNTVTWSISDDSIEETTFRFGTNKDNLDTEGVVTKMDNGNFSVEMPDLKPGTLYYFTIASASTDKLRGATYSGTLITRGFPVQLIVQHNNLLIPGATVVIGGRTFRTNDSSQILTELGDGKQIATITPLRSGESYEVKFTVKKLAFNAGMNPAIQKIVLNIQSQGQASSLQSTFLPVLIAGGVILLSVGGIITWLALKKGHNDEEEVQVSRADHDLFVTNFGNLENTRRFTPEPQLGASYQQSAPAQQVATTPPPQGQANDQPAPNVSPAQNQQPIVNQQAEQVSTPDQVESPVNNLAISEPEQDMWSAPPPLPPLQSTMPSQPIAKVAPVQQPAPQATPPTPTRIVENTTQPAPQPAAQSQPTARTTDYSTQQQTNPALSNLSSENVQSAASTDTGGVELSINHTPVPANNIIAQQLPKMGINSANSAQLQYRGVS